MTEQPEPDKNDDQPEQKDSDLGRQPGNGGFFVPPLWGKFVKFARGGTKR